MGNKGSNPLSSIGKLVDVGKILGHPMGRVTDGGETVERKLAMPRPDYYDGNYGYTRRRMEALAQTEKRDGGFWGSFGGTLGNVGGLLETFGPIGAMAIGQPQLSPVAGLAGGLLNTLGRMLQ